MALDNQVREKDHASKVVETTMTNLNKRKGKAALDQFAAEENSDLE